MHAEKSPSPQGERPAWWRRIFAAIEGMDTSGYAVMSDRHDELDRRISALEARFAPTDSSPRP